MPRHVYSKAKITTKVPAIEIVRKVANNNQIPYLVNYFGFKKVCELGVRWGDNLRYILYNTDIDLFVAVDLWEDDGIVSHNDIGVPQNALTLAYENMLELSRTDSRVTVLREFSDKASDKFADDSFDLVYIDADHTESAVTEDIRKWWPKVKIGGILCGHDYVNITTPNGVRFGVINAVNKFVKSNSLQNMFHTVSDFEMFPQWFVYKSFI